MKKFSLLILSVLLLSCSSDEDVEPFKGTFSGSYTGDDTGTWEMDIIYENGEGSGTINGTFKSNNGGNKAFSASVSPSGRIVGSFVDENKSTIYDTNLSGEIDKSYKNAVSGTWYNNVNGVSNGKWIGERN